MITAQITITPWPDDLPPNRQGIEELIQAEGVSYYQWSNGPGDVYPAHQHAFHKIIFVVKGSITFGLPDENRSVGLSAGDRLDLPAGIQHNAVVGDSGVICLEGHRT